MRKQEPSPRRIAQAVDQGWAWESISEARGWSNSVQLRGSALGQRSVSCSRLGELAAWGSLGSPCWSGWWPQHWHGHGLPGEAIFTMYQSPGILGGMELEAHCQQSFLCKFMCTD